MLQREERHEDNPVVKCPRCKEEMPLLDTERHMKECAKEDNVQCSFCPKAFKKGSFGLHAHMRQIHFWGMFRHATHSLTHVVRSMDCEEMMFGTLSRFHVFT